MSASTTALDALQQDTWATATGTEDDLSLVFRFRQHMPLAVRQASDVPSLINVYWGYDGSESNGMPPSDHYDRQIAFEEAIVPLDEEDRLGFLMLVITGNSRKEWIFYANDVDAWLARFNELLSGHSVYPIEIETGDDPDWTAWRGVAACAQN